MTQEAKHTPGPWKLAKTKNGWLIKTKDGCVLGCINQFPETAEMASQCEPNARLVVAAPKTLEALKLLCERADKILAIEPKTLEGSRFEAAVKNARAVIAEAEAA